MAFSPVIEKFRALHESGCFVMPNPWDIGSAVFLEHLGFKALATTSAGFAFTIGRSDSIDSLSLDDVLGHLRQIVPATRLPVNADFQAGYGADAAAVGESVRRCVETGVAGLSIEDATGDARAPLYAVDAALARLTAARKAIDASKTGVVLTGRCEAYLVGDPDAFKTSMDRLTRFAAAGADCLYAPRVTDPKEIAALVKAVAPKPLNVLVNAPSPDLTVARLTDLGVRRISVGGTFARIAWGAFLKQARALLETGTYDVTGAASFAELDGVFSKRR